MYFLYFSAPRFIKKLPISSEIKEGDDLTVECKVDEADPGDVIKHVHIKRKGKSIHLAVSLPRHS